MPREKDFQSHFSKWLQYEFPTKSAAFELKLCKGKSMPFSAVQDHQLAALKAVKSKGIIYKIPDTGFQNPFDCFKLKSNYSFVVIMYYKRGQKEFFMIDIDAFISEKMTSKRKSLTEKRAKEISWRMGELK